MQRIARRHVCAQRLCIGGCHLVRCIALRKSSACLSMSACASNMVFLSSNTTGQLLCRLGVLSG